MSKVVKFAVGVATLAVGIATGNPLLIAQGVGMTLGAVLSKSPKGNSATNQRLSKQLSPEDFRKIVFGRTAGATDLRFWEVHGSGNTTYSEVIAVAGHRIHSFQEFYVEEEQVGFAGNNATGAYSGSLRRTTNNGAPGNAALAVGAGSYWDASCKFTGCAHYALRWTYDQKKLPNGIPQKVTQVVEGAPVYDPRRDSTRGGSGPHRVEDQSTWEYGALDGAGQPIGRNNALQALWYLLGWRVQNPSTLEWTLVAGQGVDPIDIDFSGFIAAANDAEALSFYTDMILSTGDSHATNRAVISANDALGRFLDPGGLWTYRVNRDDTAVPAVSLTEDDVLEGSVEWIPERPMAEQYNRVVGTYIDPASLYQAKAYPQVKDATYEAADGFKKRKSFAFQGVQDEAIAQRAARIVLNEGRYQGEFKATFSFRALQAQVWDVVGLTLERYGFDPSARFRVRSQSLTASGIEMVLRQTHASVYSSGPVTYSPAPSSVAKYDPRQSIPVTGLSATAQAATAPDGSACDGARLSWDDAPANVRRTVVEYRTLSSTSWQSAGTVVPGTSSLDVQPLLPNTAYRLRARHVSIHEVPGDWVEIGLTTGTSTRTTWDGTIGTRKPEDGSTYGNNLIYNGNAESSQLGVRRVDGSTQTQIAREPTAASNGRSGWLVSKPGAVGNGAAFAFNAVPVKPGRTYRVRINMNGSSATPSGFFLRMFEKAGAPSAGAEFVAPGDSTSYTDLASNAAIPGNATDFVYLYTPAAGITFCSPTIYAWDGAPQAVRFDDLAMAEVLSWTSDVEGPRKPEDGATYGSNLIYNGNAESYGASGVRRVDGNGQTQIAREPTAASNGQSGWLVSKPGAVGYGAGFAFNAVAVKPGRTYRIRINMNGSSATPSGFFLRMFEKAGPPSAGAEYISPGDSTSYTDLASNAAVPSSATDFVYQYTAPANITFCSPAVYAWDGAPQALRFDDLAMAEVLNWDSDLGGANKPENNADVTSAITGVTEIAVACNYLGSAKDGELPKDVTYKLMRNGAQVGNAVSWSYEVLSGTVNGYTRTSGSISLSGTGATAFTVSSLGSAEAVVRLLAVFSGTARVTDVKLVKKLDLPPLNTGATGGGSTGGGSTGSSGSSSYTSNIGSVSSTTYSGVQGGPVSCVVGGAGQVNVSFSPASYSTASVGTRLAYGKIQWLNPQTQSWEDVVPDTAALSPAVKYSSTPGEPGDPPEDGQMSLSGSKTGLTAGTTHQFRLQLRGSTNAVLNFQGTLVANGAV